MNSIPEYTLITFDGVYRHNYEDDPNNEKLFNEQTEWLQKLGYKKDWYTEVTYHHFDSVFSDDYTTNDTLHDAIEALAIKDGVDLVRFENGNIGFVAYYSGYKDGFEILGKVDY